ncbi:HlyC/CorC family transporter [Phaeovibrio sulfidiphilus]|uniref:HlyC/CorC family transporter n=1 Tax=Phaeovibrio sulfidiphilus TaxID=1220600 RepID=A0A8J7CVT3_9PROT|nr:HlyC/CorC family transporter [Phaeovibrio sulfidiphilus]
MITTISIICVLIALSAFFSASETALTAASRPLLHEMERHGDRRASNVNRLLRTRERLIGTILLGNNLVNILASAMATSLFISLFGESGVAWATLVMTVGVLLLGEILPKTIALIHTTGIALKVAPVMSVLVWLLRPVTAVLQGLVYLLLYMFPKGERTSGTSSAEALSELRGAIDLHTRECTDRAARAERSMLTSILELTEVPVSDVMVHRSKVVSLNADDPVEDNANVVFTSPYSRFPLWRDRPENIVGVIYEKDLTQALRENGGTTQGLDLMTIASPPWFVPDTTPLFRQLSAFRQRRKHLALVIDEYGSLQGLVTLEDILEEIVGDILDEYDEAVPGVQSQGDGTYLVNGDVTIRDLNREFDWSLPDEEAATVAGLLIRESRTIPAEGDSFTFHGFGFRIMRRSGNRITLVRISPPEPEDQDA